MMPLAPSSVVCGFVKWVVAHVMSPLPESSRPSCRPGFISNSLAFSMAWLVAYACLNAPELRMAACPVAVGMLVRSAVYGWLIKNLEMI